MIVEQLRSKVAAALAEPDSYISLERRIDAFMQEGGSNSTAEIRQELVQLCETYVTNVVELIAACDEIAPAAGVGPVAGSVLLASANYFFEDNDLIPDKQGLLGLLDDAYLACRYIVRLSELFQAERGVPLVDTSLDNLSDAVRALLGAQLVATLDQSVEVGLSNAIAQVQWHQFQQIPISESERWAKVRADRDNNDLARGMAILSGDF